jgi:hypothetical protein
VTPRLAFLGISVIILIAQPVQSTENPSGLYFSERIDLTEYQWEITLFYDLNRDFYYPLKNNSIITLKILGDIHARNWMLYTNPSNHFQLSIDSQNITFPGSITEVSSDSEFSSYFFRVVVGNLLQPVDLTFDDDTLMHHFDYYASEKRDSIGSRNLLLTPTSWNFFGSSKVGNTFNLGYGSGTGGTTYDFSRNIRLSFDFDTGLLKNFTSSYWEEKDDEIIIHTIIEGGIIGFSFDQDSSSINGYLLDVSVFVSICICLVLRKLRIR